VKKVLLVTALFLPVAAETQRPPIRVAVSSTSTIDLGELRRAFHKKCSNVVLNRDPSRADYALEAIDKTINLISAQEVLHYRFTLFNRAGSAFYSTSPDKFSNAIDDVCVALVQQSASPAQEVDAEPVNGLRMSISRSQAASGPATQFTITFSNATRREVTFVPGTLYFCGIAPSKTSAIALNLTDSQGKQHRHLPYLGDGPPYQGFCAGRIDPFVVVLHSRESVSLPLDLSKYLDLADSKQYVAAKFHAGNYLLRAEFAMKPSDARNPVQNATNVWWGRVYSNTMQVQFDSEFAAPVDDYPDYF
jgi:hypothetical protein